MKDFLARYGADMDKINAESRLKSSLMNEPSERIRNVLRTSKLMDSPEFLRAWALDIRAQSGSSVDADYLEGAATELQNMRERRILGVAHLALLTRALADLIVIFDTHPHLPCEEGELPALDRARALYGETVRKMADGRI